MKNGGVGFYNVGNTCYVSAIMNVLLHIPSFTAIFVRNDEVYLQLSSDPKSLFRIISNLIKQAVSTSASAILPASFETSCW